MNKSDNQIEKVALLKPLHCFLMTKPSGSVLKNGEKKRQFPEMIICTTLQKNGISKIKLSGVSGLLADTENGNI
ncbi:hypothetical protein [Terrimonas pollutisoli]|uniref:hypothetical protein n=1 Tax=Terrimonas pollutisoli TaxID=3034147 RepID=UPI0023EE2573|nr:hypothetical protein [Terrimonas sp. H1YJ31]